MSTPTVRISEASHQILRELAEQTGQTMMEVLDKALDAYRRKVFFEQLNAAYDALRADPVAWAEVEEERRSMDGCLMDGLDPTECWSEDGDLLPPGERKSNA
jgi:translation elongation factor EF-Ts